MVSILGVGEAHPDTVIDNYFLESLDIGTNPEWIEERVGIKTRRTVLPLDYIRTTRNSDPRAAEEAAMRTLSDLAVEAAEQALGRAGITAQDVGMLITGTSIPQLLIPANACIIAARLDVNAPSFDLNSACSSFAAQLHFINNMNKDSLPDFILLIQAETYTMVTNYNDRSTAVLWGDGAAATVVSPRYPGKATVVTSLFKSNPSEYDKVLIPRHGHFEQQGNQVQRFAITRTVETFEELKAVASLTSDTYFIGHQANLRMLESSCKRTEIAYNRHLYNVNYYGNTGAAGAPSVLAAHWDSFKDGDELALVVVGAGLSWGGSVMRFGDSGSAR